MKIFTAKDLAPYIDHTLLKPDAGEEDLRKLCREAREFQFYGVCVNSAHVPLVVSELSGSTVQVVSVIGFPLGAMATIAKAFEAETALKWGATEIDMVLPIGFLKTKNYQRVQDDVASVAKACQGQALKVILETALLTDDEKRIACELSVHAGAKFVKTCTGFGGGGATVEDIRLMRNSVGPDVGVKASGGIKTAAAAMALIEAGANRLGTSSGPALVQDLSTGPGY